MEQVLAKVQKRGTAPTRADIDELMKSIGRPGQMRDAKRSAVAELYAQAHYSPANHQGYSMLDTLDTYGSY